MFQAPRGFAILRSREWPRADSNRHPAKRATETGDALHMLFRLSYSADGHIPVRMLWLIDVVPQREHVVLHAQPSSLSHISPSHLCSHGPPVPHAQ